jgi:quercetin dioxygenase-like cupin family protein
MTVSFAHSHAAELPIRISAIGLDLFVRLSSAETDGEFCFIETINAPGTGPPQHRHREAEIFRVIEGRYLYQVDGCRFFAEAGDVVSIPGGAAHGFVNVTDTPARQYILLAPALDAVAFFTELAGTMRKGNADHVALNVFGKKWGVEFLGPPLDPQEPPTG